MNTGKILARLREEKKWSQTDLANQSGVSRVMIGNMKEMKPYLQLKLQKKWQMLLA